MTVGTQRQARAHALRARAMSLVSQNSVSWSRHLPPPLSLMTAVASVWTDSVEVHAEAVVSASAAPPPKAPWLERTTAVHGVAPSHCTGVLQAPSMIVLRPSVWRR